MTSETKALVRARAVVIRDALESKRIDPDPLTATALLYLCMQILKLPGDQLMESLPDSLRASAAAIAKTVPNPNDPSAPVLLTQLELATLINAKVGNA